MKTTFFAKPGEIEKKWVIIDATDKAVGRIATKAASIIRGTTKTTFTPHTDTGDNVIIINAVKVKLTGKKWDDKVYYHHTGWSGGIKSITAKEVLEKIPKIPGRKFKRLSNLHSQTQKKMSFWSEPRLLRMYKRNGDLNHDSARCYILQTQTLI